MTFSECFGMAWKNIMSSKMRSLLTMLGIIIGVTAVIVIMGMGNGMENYMRESFQELGTNNMTVTLIGRGNSSTQMSYEELQEIVEENPDDFDLISPTVTMTGTVKIGSETMDATSVTGVGEDYFEIKSLHIAQGRGIQYVDELKRTYVCVIGSYLNNTMFNGNGIGETLKIDGREFTVVGVLEEKADSEEGGSDDVIYVPYSTASRLSFTGMMSTYILTIVSEDRASESKTVMENALYNYYKDDDSYMVSATAEALETMTSMLNVVITVLAVIAGISLVVGGIGIMNIMLVSVTGRTREIGIRKALGSKEKYILMQFVTESALTSALGGIIGILLGYLLSAAATEAITQLMEADITVSPDLGSVLLAFSISAGIGVFFGYMPAKKAAQMNPIDALRYD